MPRSGEGDLSEAKVGWGAPRDIGVWGSPTRHVCSLRSQTRLPSPRRGMRRLGEGKKRYAALGT